MAISNLRMLPLLIGLGPPLTAIAAQSTDRLPLAPSRQIEFTTTEGTWMSVDLSPDGQTIVFDLLGDLYTLPIGGGAATPLVTGFGFESQPRFAPDGRQVVFISDQNGADNVWIAAADGSNRRRISTERHVTMFSPAWFPDGQSVVVSVIAPTRFQGAAELWRYDIATGTRTFLGQRTRNPGSPLVSSPAPGAFGAVPTKNGHTLYFADVEPRPYRSTEGPKSAIVRLDLATNQAEPLTPRAAGMKPVLSPDGKALLYASAREGTTGLKLRDLATGDERWVLFPFQRSELDAHATRDVLPNVAFTPDGTGLIFAAGGQIRRLEVATGKTTVVPFTATVRLDLGPRLDFPRSVAQGPVRARVLAGPTLTNDGSRLAVSAFAEVYTMTLPNGTPRRLTKDLSAREFNPAWSPDGSWLTYVTWTVDGGHLWRAQADGTGPPQRLTTHPASYAQPAVSPDGRWIVALRNTLQARRTNSGPFPTPDGDLVVLPATGGPVHRIAASRGMVRPHFRPAEERVYGTVPGEGLISIRLDGSDRRSHLLVTATAGLWPPATADDIRVSPNGDAALALVGQQVYWLPLPAAGPTPPRIEVTADSSKAVRLSITGADGFGWSADGREAFWTLGATVFRRAVPHGAVTPPLAAEVSIAIEKPRATPAGRVVLRGGTVITMRGTEVLRNVDVVVTGNRITAIGKRGSVLAGRDTRVIDVTGRYLIPGLVDVHAHWDLRRGILDTENSAALANLAYGVTTVRDPQSFTPDIFAYADLIEVGEMVGPRVFSTGPGIIFVDFRSVDDTRAAIAKYRDHYRTHLLKSYLIGNREQRQWLVQAALESRMMPTTEGGADLKLDLTHAIDGMSGNEHALPTAPIFDDVVQLFARSGIAYTPTLLVAFGGPFAQHEFFTTEDVLGNRKLGRFIPRDALVARAGGRQAWYHPSEYHYPAVAAGAAAIVRAGGRVALGSHGELEGIGSHWELRALARGGMTNHELLAVATINGALAIGLGHDLGSLEPGKLADLVILDRNPLADIRNAAAIRYVMKNGVLYQGETLDQLWPRVQPLPTPWWGRE